MRMSSRRPTPSATAWRIRTACASVPPPREPPPPRAPRPGRAPVDGRRGRAGRAVARVGSSPSSKNDNWLLLGGRRGGAAGLSMPRRADRPPRPGRPLPPAARERARPPRRARAPAGTGRPGANDGVGADPRRAAHGGRRPGRLVLGRYRLTRRLGAGGFGVVYAAHDEQLDREVAVKRIVCADATAARRAEREARAAARLAHPGIVALYEAARDDEAVYLVSELVEGRSLAELEREGLLSDRDVLRAGVALCDALAHAHRRGVVHRDVKPANVLVPDAPGAGLRRGEAHGLRRRVDGGRRRPHRARRRGRDARLHGPRAGGRRPGRRARRRLRPRPRPLRGARGGQPGPGAGRRRDRPARRGAPAGAGPAAPRPPARPLRGGRRRGAPRPGRAARPADPARRAGRGRAGRRRRGGDDRRQPARGRGGAPGPGDAARADAGARARSWRPPAPRASVAVVLGWLAPAAAPGATPWPRWPRPRWRPPRCCCSPRWAGPPPRWPWRSS